MQDSHLFEYAIIRVVPRVEREEFINVGVIVYCAKKKFLKAVFKIDEARLNVFSETLEITTLSKNLDAFVRISEGKKAAGPIAAFDAASRFRWLTAVRSTVLQTSRVHPGFCKDPEEKLWSLFAEQVS